MSRPLAGEMWWASVRGSPVLLRVRDDEYGLWGTTPLGAVVTPADGEWIAQVMTPTEIDAATEAAATAAVARVVRWMRTLGGRASELAIAIDGGHHL